MRLGLDRTQALLERIGNPERELRFIHVAGTNGKGSCVATCEAILRGRGLRTGAYTSPHLVDFRERIRVDGEMISGEGVAAWVNRWLPAIEATGATFFEATTAMAFEWFRDHRAEIVVLETGLGGRLDSTNVVDPLVATVVSIGLEHTELLGGSVEAIAREKGGIFKHGRPAVIGHAAGTAKDVLLRCATEVGAEPIVDVAERYPVRHVSAGPDGTRAVLGAGRGELRLRTPLVGRHQAANLACSLATLEVAGESLLPPFDDLEESLEAIDLPGRFQREGSFIFDVAHNPDGIRVLTECISAVDPPRPLAAVVCIMGDKEWEPMLTELARVVDTLVLTHAPSIPPGRGWDLASAGRLASVHEPMVTIEPDFDGALDKGRQLGATCLVTGSFHTVGDAMARLQLSPYTR